MKKILVPIITLIVSLICLDNYAQEIAYESFGKGIKVQAKDSSFYAKIGFRFQSLFSSSLNLENDVWDRSMMIRRSRLKAEGWALSPKFSYKVELALSNRDIKGGSKTEFGNTANIILDAVLKYHINSNWSLWFGQTKLPGNRERVFSSQKLQFVDRSLVNARFNLDRDVGVQLHHKGNIGNLVVKEAFSLSLGNGRNVIINDENGYQYTGRIEFLPMGEFTGKGDYYGADLAREKTLKMAIGITADYNNNAFRSRGNLGNFLVDPVSGDYITDNLNTLFVDAIVKKNGFSSQAVYAIRKSPNSLGDFGVGQGLNLQAGYVFTNKVEFAARYTNINAELISSLNDQSEYALGFSKYFSGHNLKCQADLSYHDLELTEDDFLRFRLQVEFAL
ncbi:MAG: FmdC precursor [Flammeovirgaceae bacterium]|jgi:phosphate-selective porin OprO and OprP|nr:FmdC precursor [Flammeovirgaceae bacterium]